MRIVKIGFVGFLVSFLLAVLLGQSVWLEMRVRVGMVIPWFVLLFIFWGLRKRLRTTFFSVLLLQGVLLLTFLVAYHFQWGALTVVPATLVREGLYLTSLGLRQANVVLVLILAAGNAAWLIPPFPRAAIPAGNPGMKTLTRH